MTLAIETLVEAAKDVVVGCCIPDDRTARELARAVLTAIEQAGYVVVQGWQAIETAPYDTHVEIRAGGMTLLAELQCNAAVNEDEEACDQWVAVLEGEYPPCWSGGACWESNEGGMMSLQPTAWRHPAAPKIQHSEGEG